MAPIVGEQALESKCWLAGDAEIRMIMRKRAAAIIAGVRRGDRCPVVTFRSIGRVAPTGRCQRLRRAARLRWPTRRRRRLLGGGG